MSRTTKTTKTRKTPKTPKTGKTSKTCKRIKTFQNPDWIVKSFQKIPCISLVPERKVR